MTVTWNYCGAEYETEALAEAAALSMKDRLDNNPTEWAIVKQVSGSDADGWVVPVAALTDSEINNLNAAGTYMVASVVGPDNDFGLTSSEAAAKVADHKASYANFMQVNTIVRVEVLEGVDGADDVLNVTTRAPSSVDMSIY